MPFGTYTGAGVIFGVSGGVTEAVLRRVVSDKSPTSFRSLAYTGVRGMNGVKEASVMYGDRKLKVAVVSGLKNAGTTLDSCAKQFHKAIFYRIWKVSPHGWDFYFKA